MRIIDAKFTVEPARPQGDLISRQDAIDALEEQLDYLQMLNKNENPTAEGKWYGVNWARNTIADLPYKQNERPQGDLAEKLKDRIEESVCKYCQMNKHCEICETVMPSV